MSIGITKQQHEEANEKIRLRFDSLTGHRGRGPPNSANFCSNKPSRGKSHFGVRKMHPSYYPTPNPERERT
jgi:hypothetical protein